MPEEIQRFSYGFDRWDAPRALTKALSRHERFDDENGEFPEAIAVRFGFSYLDVGSAREVWVNERLGMVLKYGDGNLNMAELDSYETMRREGIDHLAARIFWHSPNLVMLLQEYVPEIRATGADESKLGEAADLLLNYGIGDVHHGNVGFLRGQPVIFDLDCGLYGRPNTRALGARRVA